MRIPHVGFDQRLRAPGHALLTDGPALTTWSGSVARISHPPHHTTPHHSTPPTRTPETLGDSLSRSCWPLVSFRRVRSPPMPRAALVRPGPRCGVQPLANADVSIGSLNAFVRTDSSGMFQFRSLDPETSTSPFDGSATNRRRSSHAHASAWTGRVTRENGSERMKAALSTVRRSRSSQRALAATTEHS